MTWDANDTSALDPREDEDIEGYVSKYFEAQPGTWATWAEPRLALGSTAPDHVAALKAMAHADTQGRVFLTLADNVSEKLATRVEFDIEGKGNLLSSSRDLAEAAPSAQCRRHCQTADLAPLRVEPDSWLRHHEIK